MKTTIAILLGAGLVAACTTTGSDPARPTSADEIEIRALLVELYRAFSFDPGQEPDWEIQRRAFLAGAAFVPPMRSDRAPVAQGAERFLADFRDHVSAPELQATGFHERIVGLRIDAFGGVAHAFVAFEGFEPGDGRAVTRGLDSLQLVRTGAGWRLVSFTTQYERDGLRIPERFLGEPGH